MSLPHLIVLQAANGILYAPNSMERANRTLLLMMSAAAYSLAFPPLGWWPLALLGTAVLTGMLYDARPSRGMMAGFFWGLIAFGAGLSWLWNIFGALSILLWGILAVFPAMFGWLVSLARQRGVQGRWLTVYIALAWTGTEFLRCELMPLRFPWMNLGLALEPWPLASWTGVYGLGFLAMLAVTAMLLRTWSLALAVCVLLSLDWHDPLQEKGAMVRVAAVQAEGAATQTYMDLGSQAPNPQLIVWPEQTLPIDVRNVAKAELAAVQSHAAHKDALIVFGTQTRLTGPLWQNTALTVDGTQVLGSHVKNHPVHLFNDGEKGSTALPVHTVLGTIGTPICFDCDFHDVVRRMTAAGAEFFAVPSMDAASWSARQHIQHSQLFRVRAAENGRWMVVAASSGVSQIINSKGKIVTSLAPMQTGCIHGSVERRSDLTFYTRAGWLTPWIALLLLTLWTTVLLTVRRKKQPATEAVGTN